MHDSGRLLASGSARPHAPQTPPAVADAIPRLMRLLPLAVAKASVDLNLQRHRHYYAVAGLVRFCGLDVPARRRRARRGSGVSTLQLSLRRSNRSRGNRRAATGRSALTQAPDATLIECQGNEGLRFPNPSMRAYSPSTRTAQ